MGHRVYALNWAGIVAQDNDMPNEVLHMQRFEQDPKMSLYGRTMLKIKMIVTGGRAQIMIQ
jgi:hypothetical protein